MKQSEEKKRTVLPEEDNRRSDWKQFDIVERGIEMDIDHGYSSAARFEKHDIAPEIIERGPAQATGSPGKVVLKRIIIQRMTV